MTGILQRDVCSLTEVPTYAKQAEKSLSCLRLPRQGASVFKILSGRPVTFWTTLDYPGLKSDPDPPYTKQASTDWATMVIYAAVDLRHD